MDVLVLAELAEERISIDVHVDQGSIIIANFFAVEQLVAVAQV